MSYPNSMSTGTGDSTEVHYRARLVIERIEKDSAPVMRDAERSRNVTEVVNLALKGSSLKALAAKLLKHVNIIIEEEDE